MASPMPDPPRSYGSESLEAAPARPAIVETSFWLYVLAVLLNLVGTILAITAYPALRDAAAEQARRQLEEQGQDDVIPPGTFETIMDVTFGVGIAIGLIGVLLYVLFGIFARRGANWARIVLTVLAGLSLLMMLFGLAVSAVPLGSPELSGAEVPESPGAQAIGIAQQVCVVVATVLLWLPAPNAWFHRMGEHRRARRQLG